MRVPLATYRLQLRASFGFKEAAGVVDYLKDLGITDAYLSPVFKAREGSTHGYDVVDPTELNPELGGEDAFEALAEKLKNAGMGLVQDIVPNHMAYDGENTFLMDVLENGPNSLYYGFFDIQWDHYYEGLTGRLLAPFLGTLYGESLEKGEITLGYDEHGLHIRFYELRLPLKIESYARVLTAGLAGLRKKLGPEDPDFVKFLGVLYTVKNLPPSDEDLDERYAQVRFIKRILRELYNSNPEIREFIDSNLKLFGGKAGGHDKLRLLDSLLGEQLFRLSFWKVASEEINYRRFFSINGLISLKTEEAEVFTKTHSLITGLCRKGLVTGLRIDHIDGLLDPAGYLGRLREDSCSAYTVVEKVLDAKESLPGGWPVEGTTGYDFMNAVNGVFCFTGSRAAMSRTYSSFTGVHTPYEEILYDKKKLIIQTHMTGDVDNLAHTLKSISAKDRYGSDLTLYGLKRAIVETMSCFPVYRTYIRGSRVERADRLYIKEAVERARNRNPGLVYEIDFLGRFLLLEFREGLTDDEKSAWVDFVMRFQQYTGPLMAKGFEDTFLYIYNRLLSLNEVGGSPDRFGTTAKEFHAFNSARAEKWPHTMNATSSHDTKRGEDVRARINVLSELPEEWSQRVKTWHRANRNKRKRQAGRVVPGKNDEYLLYQTLIGACPPGPGGPGEMEGFAGRIKDYIVKAVREAKVYTAWLKPDTEYEEAFSLFIDRILDPEESREFLDSFIPFQRKVAFFGALNSLSQLLLKVTSPGVPDFYQGTELWDLSLVDPDNRRPVDYARRRSLLEEIRKGEAEDLDGLVSGLLENIEDPGVKLFLTRRLLRARAGQQKLFQEGSYLGLGTDGAHRESIVAFAREHQGRRAITVAPRFLTRVVKAGEVPLGEAWGDTSLEVPDGWQGGWKDAVTGLTVIVDHNGKLPLAEILKTFPAALLLSEDAS